MTRRHLSIRLGLGTLAFAVAQPTVAKAWAPATTQPGLVEKAALASNLHDKLTGPLGLALGLFEPLALPKPSAAAAAGLEPERLTWLWQRLAALDPSAGNTPDSQGTNLALNWLAAGAVMENTPPERGRHHFLDPLSGRGLHDDPGLTGMAHSLRLALDGRGGVRGLATGTTFDLTGRPALSWALAEDNELGLPRFLTSLERTASGETPEARRAALVEALLSLGALGSVLADMGEPAHVRNDFRGAYLRRGGGAGSWDRGSDFEAFVAARYGRAGVPSAAAPVERPTLSAFFTAPDGRGLADETQRRFFSAGTVPENVAVDANTTPLDVKVAANGSLTYPQPRVDRLRLRRTGKQYLVSNGLRQLAYERVPGQVLFSLDEAVYLDSAEAWLPIVGSYVSGLFNQLTRVQVAIKVGHEGAGGRAEVTLSGFSGPARGELLMYAEDAAGIRRKIAAPVPFSAEASSPSPENQATGPTQIAENAPPARPSQVALSLVLPPGVKRVAVSVRGQDAAGAFVGVGEHSAP